MMTSKQAILFIVLMLSSQMTLSTKNNEIEGNDIKLLEMRLKIIQEKIKEYEEDEIKLRMMIDELKSELHPDLSGFLSIKIKNVETDNQLTGDQKSKIIKMLEADERDYEAKESLLKLPETETLKLETHTVIPQKVIDESEHTRDVISKIVDKSSTASVENEKDNKLKKATKAVKPLFVVQKGDTLSDIALKAYNDSSYYIYIYNANKSILSSPDQLPDGLKLKIPGLLEIERN